MFEDDMKFAKSSFKNHPLKSFISICKCLTKAELKFPSIPRDRNCIVLKDNSHCHWIPLSFHGRDQRVKRAVGQVMLKFISSSNFPSTCLLYVHICSESVELVKLKHLLVQKKGELAIFHFACQTNQRCSYIQAWATSSILLDVKTY